MTDWQITMALIMGGIAVGLLYNIFLEVRSIRRMMNHDRSIQSD